MERLLILGLVLNLSLGLSLPQASVADEPKRGGTLTMGVLRDLRLMNPLVRTSSSARRLRSLMFEPLLAVDRNWEIQPNLAESWGVSEDGKIYTFRLREGVRFHDGQDVKFSIDYTLNSKNGAYGRRYLAPVKRVEAADSHTLKVLLKQPSPGFLAALTSIQALSVVPKESLAQGVRKPAQFPAGTGPFRFVEWKPKQRIVLERFDGYWGGEGPGRQAGPAGHPERECPLHRPARGGRGSDRATSV